MESVQVREIPLFLQTEQARLDQFLKDHDLKLEADVDTAFGLFEEDELVGCGCAAGAILKCFAIDQHLRGQNGMGALISRLSANRFMKNYTDLMVFTRPHNVEMFSRCGFYPVISTEQVALLENNPSGVENYLNTLPRPTPEYETVGAIVMNCNPFTLGHQALIQYAADHCEFLYVFVVEEDRSVFPFADRIRLVKEGTHDLPQVHVCPSGPYMISQSTFPTYFLKNSEDPSAVQSELDVTLFASRIAPRLGITIRFAGEEPLDPVTAQYNETMARILPEYGLKFVSIPRLCSGAHVISASRVRSLLDRQGGLTKDSELLVPPCTAAYLEGRFGRITT